MSVFTLEVFVSKCAPLLTVLFRIVVLQKSKPQTVQEVMQRIGLPQYTDRLLADGWDELEFLRDLTEADLESAEVPKDHRRVVSGLKTMTEFYFI